MVPVVAVVPVASAAGESLYPAPPQPPASSQQQPGSGEVRTGLEMMVTALSCCLAALGRGKHFAMRRKVLQICSSILHRHTRTSTLSLHTSPAVHRGNSHNWIKHLFYIYLFLEDMLH